MWRCASAARRRTARALQPIQTHATQPTEKRIAQACVPQATRFQFLHSSSKQSSSTHLRSIHQLQKPLPTSISLVQQKRWNSTSLEDSVESIYQKKTPLEHVLLRPGMYIGSVEPTKDTMWIPASLSSNAKPKDMKMQQKAVEYVPAMYKIFDEIIVNAVDNKVRDTNMKHLDVVIDAGSKDNNYRPWISIYNDGKGIPIKYHKQEQVYVPELVLGHLLTGSNFDDSSARLTGGRHGYGAKLTNIFSSEFTVETGDAMSGKLYQQTWRNNMRERGEPEISEQTGTPKDFTKVSFCPDLSRFDMEKLTTGMERVLRKRVVDVAGCLSGVDVTLNGQKIPLSGFESYVDSFRHSTVQDAGEDGAEYIYTKVNKRWQVGVLPSDVGFVQVSFVNGMSALRGGTHVNYVSDQICRRVADHINKKHSELSVTPAHVKPHLALFVNCLIENPTFDSQMKEYMSSRPTTYGSSCVLSERFSKHVIQSSGIVERVVESAKSKQRAALMKKVSSNRNKTTVNIPKLEDANLAGGARSSECALILTEGDSAKALAVAGLAVVGRDTYGVFPLRGKLLNVRDATDAQLAKNAEFASLCTILGLQIGQKYDTPEALAKLRYGKVIVMTDQDHDGSHIKGLLFNLFHSFWPELLQTPNFISEFITPIIKVTPRKGKKKEENSLRFFSQPEYMSWRDQLDPSEVSNYSIKYYKGLGTSTSTEGRAYFSDLPQHLVDFHWSGEEDGDKLEMVFSKSRAPDRRDWLQNVYRSDAFLDTSSGHVNYKDFVDRELIQFSHADNYRSLPSLVDGLKPSQRKVLFACLKRKLSSEVKVAQLAGYCSEHTAYHHGEASLHSTIVNMAQDYVGSNNLPLLFPSGQFGTRLQGGKDAASPRYIFTMLQKHTRMLFPEEDEPLLSYVDDDGYPVEPVHYVPTLPMLLVNGSDGIGTGWSSSIPTHHPVQIIDNLLKLLDANDREEPLDSVELDEMLPWVKGFTGRIVQTGQNTFTTQGKAQVVNTSTIRISELPVGKWVEDYKKFLLDLVSKKSIRSFAEHHSERDVRFDISMSRNDVTRLTKDTPEATNEALVKMFKLESGISTSNMHAFDASGQLIKLNSSEDILRSFFPVRLQMYQERKEYQESEMSRALSKLQNRIRFIREVADGELSMVLQGKTPKAELVQMLQDKEFVPQSAFVDQETPVDITGEYDYLLNTSLMSFTKEHAERLQSDHDHRVEKLETLRNKTPAQLWKEELEALKDTLLKDKEYR